MGQYDDLLQTGWSRDQILVKVRFPASVQTGTGPTQQYNRYWVLPEGKAARAGVDQPPIPI
jgi:hypothetical protein